MDRGTAGATARDLVFVSYSRKDAFWLKRLRTHLKPYERKGSLEVWDDQRIQTGARWIEEIKTALGRARVAVLLVSPDYLASDFIAEHELPNLLSREKDLRVVWIPVRPSTFATTEIGKYQAALDPARSLAEMNEAEADRALALVTIKIELALRQPLAQRRKGSGAHLSSRPQTTQPKRLTTRPQATSNALTDKDITTPSEPPAPTSPTTTKTNRTTTKKTRAPFPRSHSLAQPSTYCLIVVDGLNNDRGQTLSITSGKTLIGKGTQCNLRLADPSVSMRHLEVAMSGHGPILRDLNSKPQTWVNQKLVEEQLIFHGDEIRIGSTRMLCLAKMKSARQLPIR